MLVSRLAEAAPGLEPVAPLERLGSGFYSHAFMTASGWVVRVARTGDAADRHAMESRVLPLLAGRLPIAVPQPVRLLGTGPSTRYGAFGYRALAGRLMTERDAHGPGRSAFAASLAEGLAALHATPSEMVADEAMERLRPASFSRLRNSVLPELRKRLTASEWGRVTGWWDRFLADPSLRDFEPVLTHGDAWWENLLVDDGRVTGMIDWEWLSVGDAAWDLASAHQMGDLFAGELWRAYAARRPLDPGARHRADQWWALRAFFGIEFAVVREDEEEWVDSLRNLREGPILR